MKAYSIVQYTLYLTFPLEISRVDSLFVVTTDVC